MELLRVLYDLIVIGAGPAGSSAAITARCAGARVLLLERGSFPRNKVCGEFVSPESLQLLSSLLETSGMDLLERAPRIERARIFSDGLMLVTRLSAPAASIARLDLDACLWKSAGECGVERRDRTPVRAVAGTGPFHVATANGTFEGRAVINATGRWSCLTAGTREEGIPQRRWIGVKAHFADPQPSPTVDLYFFEGGYCGLQPVPLCGQPDGQRINVCAMVRPDVAHSLEGVFEQHPLLRERSRKWRRLTATVTTFPLYFSPPVPVDGAILLAGDAAGFVDPFVGDGISLALRSGERLAQTLAPFFHHQISLAEATQAWCGVYRSSFIPVYRAAARLRPLFLHLPPGLRRMVLHGLRLSPGLVQHLVRSTRCAGYLSSRPLGVSTATFTA